MKNTRTFISLVIERLENAGIPAAVFGGWAEELTGAISPREHNDLDLFYFANDFESVDHFIRTNSDITEIKLKRFSHKRAFIYHGIMVELMLLKLEDNKTITTFWDDYLFEWPAFEPKKINILKNRSVDVIPPEIVNYYRERYDEIDIIRKKHVTT